VLDLLITGATVVDGTGAPRFTAAIGIAGDRIAWIGGSGAQPPEAARAMDARGRTLAPGFIDVHNHSDASAFVDPAMRSTVRMGATTVVVGNCGASAWPLAGWRDCIAMAGGEPETEPPGWASFGDYLVAIDDARPAVNVAALVGHGAVREAAIGQEARAPSDEELRAMRRLVGSALEDGAVGLSTGLIYVPGIHSDTDEIVALAQEAGAREALYASHIRGEGAHLFRAVDEAIAIGRRADVPVHISHLKCESSLVWGRAGDLLERLHAAGDVTADQYPYAAWNSSLASLLPPWADVRGLERLARDAATRDRLRHAVEVGDEGFQSSVLGVGWDRIGVVATADERWQGRHIQAIAAEMGFEPYAAFLRLLIEDPETSCIGHAMDEDDVRTILADPEVFVASDAAAVAPDGPRGDVPVHPRDYGTFPRALAIARDERVLPLEAAVRKMTSLPAERFGLRDRGRISEGAFADLVLFDHADIADAATYDRPHAFPVGVSLVVVNGGVAWEDGAVGGSRTGRVLRR
jgi:N-acyl-D-amino-acid deacylase